LLAIWNTPLTLGILSGLMLGKLIGITGLAWITLRLGLGRLPQNLSDRHVVGIGLLGGVGFTMSVFIANLGFASSPEDLVAAKTAILMASLCAGVAGVAWLWLGTEARSRPR
jgi:NhaA family Na+:H+ antiporter